MRNCTAIALSGGIDSLVSAALLQDQGHQVIGLHFLSGYEAGIPSAGASLDKQTFAAIEDHSRRTLHPMADQLKIPLHIIDLRIEFRNRVVNYFVETYAKGQTPNPCLVCNPSIKFDVLLKAARALGASKIASGHYARIEMAGDGKSRLLRGIDNKKDQSYFLSRLSQEQLASIILPLGNLTKAHTRRIARRRGLIPVTAQESQDICFIKYGTYGDFLTRQTGFIPKPGPIEDVEGRLLGNHKGLHQFTIGQRRGINIPAVEPYYVVRMDPRRNCLIVGNKKNLFSDQCRVSHINWISGPPDEPTQVMTRVRYRHKAVAATITPIQTDCVEVRFETPEPAITPGQGAVFYRGEEVLGGGWIE